MAPKLSCLLFQKSGDFAAGVSMQGGGGARRVVGGSVRLTRADGQTHGDDHLPPVKGSDIQPLDHYFDRMQSVLSLRCLHRELNWGVRGGIQGNRNMESGGRRSMYLYSKSVHINKQ